MKYIDAAKREAQKRGRVSGEPLAEWIGRLPLDVERCTDSPVRQASASDYCDLPCPECGKVLDEHVIVTRHRNSACPEQFTGPALPRAETAGPWEELRAMQRHHALVAEEDIHAEGARPTENVHAARAARDRLFASKLKELLAKHGQIEGARSGEAPK